MARDSENSRGRSGVLVPETEHLVGAKFVEVREALDAEDARWL
ncbi:hypothetical protein ACVWXQ_009752 [Bradyrhizobium sp. S3.14.4]